MFYIFLSSGLETQERTMDFGDEEEEEEEEVQEETVAVVAAAAMTVGQMTRVEEGQENEVSYGRKDKTNSSEFPTKIFKYTV